MRQILVSVDVFALIWANRKHPESNENEILERVLSEHTAQLKALEPCLSSEDFDASLVLDGPPSSETRYKSDESLELKTSKGHEMIATLGKTRWVDDVRAALLKLGGSASLHQIYSTVEEIRSSAGRSVPKSLDATVRRTIEDHSSDSDNFRGADIFRKVARGEWALRTKG